MWRQNHPDFTPCQHCPSCVLLPAISKLLKVASHPYLLKEYRHNTDNDSHSKTYEFACTALTDTHLVELGGPVFSSSILSGSRIEMSGKMKALDRLLSHFSSHFDKVISLPFPSFSSGSQRWTDAGVLQQHQDALAHRDVCPGQGLALLVITSLSSL
jgi:SNF2 family DNA or RNA helicase